MNITDEQLSAFLDAELSETEMEFIREQLIEDENLANRLAELAIVDELVVKAYSTIDAEALPQSITQLLSNDSLPKETERQETPAAILQNARIIEFPLWRKIRSNMTQYAAIAASVMLVIGFGMKHIIPGDDWQNIAQVLETQTSGVEKIIDDTYIKPRLTFINKNGNYCRQFDLHNTKSASANIACRQNNEWQLISSISLDKTQETANYKTATNNSALDELIDEMAVGEYFDAQAEADVINKHWSK
jgi:negative regulator of sigma E activity